MFDKLLDFLLSFWNHIIPFYVIPESEEAVVLRLGKFRQSAKPGFYWKIPFADVPMTHHVVWQTINLQPQSLTTKDDKSIVVKAIIKFRVSDIKVFLLEVWDSPDAISDMTMGIIRDEVMEHTWQQIRDGKLDKVISRKVKAEAKRWGIEVDTVTLIDMAIMRSIRLFNEIKNHLFD